MLLLVGLMVGGVAVGLLALAIVSIGNRPRTSHVSDDKPQWQTARVGCPVLFTEQTRFGGGRRCFQLGAERELPPPSVVPVMSVAVRPGYHVVGYGKPDFQGEPTLNLRGPADRVYVDLEAEPVSGRSEEVQGERKRSTAPPVVRSLRIRLDTEVTPAAARRRRAERPSGGPG